MKKREKIVVGIVSVVFFMTIYALNVYAYDGNAAVSYAGTHMSSGHTNKGYNCPNSWLCAEFVSNCIRAGGISDIYATGCRTFYNQCAARGTVYTLSKGSVSSGAYPVLTSGNGANLEAGDVLVSYCASCDKYLHTALISKKSGGYFYGYEHNANRIDGKIWFSKCSSGHTPTIYGIHLNRETSGSSDEVKPSIQNVKVVDRYKNGFKIQCFVSDNVGVSKVQFPTWESTKTSEGCVWYDGTYIGNGIWEFNFPNAVTEGYYTTHIYAWDAAGNYAVAGMEDIYVDKTKPSISDVRVTDVTADGYKVSCIVKDNYAIDRVQFPTWTSNNGQDDVLSDWGTSAAAKGTDCGNGVYEFYVKRSEHNNEFGNYETHIYAYDAWGNFTCMAADIINLENVPPTFSDVAIINQTEEGYTVTCKAMDDSGIGKIDVCVWTKENGQDDIVVGHGKYEGDDLYTCDVKYSDHNNEYGEYITHVYAYDTLENQVFCGEFIIENQVFLPEIKDESTESSEPTEPSNPVEPSEPTKPGNPIEPNEPTKPSNSAVPNSTETPNASNRKNDVKTMPSKGTVITYGGLKYKVTKAGKEVAFVKPIKNTYQSVIIPDTIIHDRITYKVTSIAKNAFKNNKKIKAVTIGKNVTTIGANAFYGCSKLKTLKIKSTNLTTKRIGSKAFSKTPKSMKVTIPKKKFKTYKSMLIKKGLNKKAEYKKG